MDKRFISVTKAAKIASVTPETIRNWCNDKRFKIGEFGIGIKRAGKTWIIDRTKLDLIINNNIKTLKTILKKEQDEFENPQSESYQLKLLSEIKENIQELETLIIQEDGK
jgi:hypothetical protein